jgi:SAM-dependent methyltransferase
MESRSQTIDLPVPPEELRIRVGPFSDAGLFERSGDRQAAEIVDLCEIGPDASVLEVGCGCGRLARAFARHLHPRGRYCGFDVSRAMVAWCRENLQARLPGFRFTPVDVYAADQNPAGLIQAARFSFPYADGAFDAAIVSSVFTHMLPDEIETYTAEVARVLKRGGRCYVTAFLFDEAGAAAVAGGTTIFDFRHPIGPCLTFDREHPERGIACRKQWLLGLLERHGLRVGVVRNGTWRSVRSYEVVQDCVVATKRGETSG